MARLFLEINDNQKRVPSSLRWDLVRLVRPDDDPFAIGAAEIVKELVEDPESPLFQRIDLTGEQSELHLKQGSLAPDIKRIISTRSPLNGLSYDEQYTLVLRYFISLSEIDPDGWGNPDSNIYKTRVIRAFLQLMTEVVATIAGDIPNITSADFSKVFSTVNLKSLDYERIKAAQGNAGIASIKSEIRGQLSLA